MPQASQMALADFIKFNLRSCFSYAIRECSLGVIFFLAEYNGKMKENLHDVDHMIARGSVSLWVSPHQVCHSLHWLNYT